MSEDDQNVEDILRALFSGSDGGIENLPQTSEIIERAQIFSELHQLEDDSSGSIDLFANDSETSPIRLAPSNWYRFTPRHIPLDYNEGFRIQEQISSIRNQLMVEFEQVLGFGVNTLPDTQFGQTFDEWAENVVSILSTGNINSNVIGTVIIRGYELYQNMEQTYSDSLRFEEGYDSADDGSLGG